MFVELKMKLLCKNELVPIFKPRSTEEPPKTANSIVGQIFRTAHGFPITALDVGVSG